MFLAHVWKLLKLLPSVVSSLLSLKDVITSLYEKWKKAREEKRIQDGRELAHEIKSAKTDAEREKALQHLDDLLRK